MHLSTAFALLISGPLCSAVPDDDNENPAPTVEERQLPFAMHSKMEERPTISVGQTDAALTGTDNRVLQAAVDYIAAIGGGTVTIGPGEFLMRDSLHLRSGVTVRGTKDQTVLRKADSSLSTLALDGDFGEQQITLDDSEGFAVGAGVAVWDSNANGFHTTVARITGRTGHTYSIDRPLMADCMVRNGAKASTVFPVVSGYDLRDAVVQDLIIEGNKDNNEPLNGCRGGGIFLYRAFGTQISGCIVRNYNGDGISFQQSNDVTVLNCVSESNAALGLHPGSGSQRPTIRDCVARHNGTDGLFLCWRVRHGLFEDNLLESNGQFGISIGHKDSDNLLRRNRIRNNDSNGVFFRNESAGMAAHRNRLEDNIIENNGRDSGTAAIRIRGATDDLVFQRNVIRDTRPSDSRTQTVGVLIEETVGGVTLTGNQIESDQAVDDRRVTPQP